MKNIVWFRNDLRLSDNPALREASRGSNSIIPIYILNQKEPWALGGASRVWLHHSLAALETSIREKGGKLYFFSGDPLKVLEKLIEQTGAHKVYWNRTYEPHNVELGNHIKVALRDKGVEALSFNAQLLAEPWQIKNASNEPYKVFTPYWKAAKKLYAELPPVLKAPSHLTFESRIEGHVPLSELKLLSGHPWEKKIMQYWRPGEEGARKQLRRLTPAFLGTYPETRDLPAAEGTSMLSPHLHFGEISPKQIVDAVGLSAKAETFVRQLAWREFGHNLLYYFPHTPTEPMNPQFNKFAWKKNTAAFERWKTGQTGFPIVDAGMRQLWETGWMHNRVRMIVASFLIKDLLIHWQEGSLWFWDTLVDADLANNTMGWQWVAGSGADAAPFFRIFNPVLQGKKFDPEGRYVKEWIPELSKLPAKFVHEPWNLERSELRLHGIELGKTYPKPMVDHGEARDKALEIYQSLKG